MSDKVLYQLVRQFMREFVQRQWVGRSGRVRGTRELVISQNALRSRLSRRRRRC
jgi:hypothetical protein